MSAKATSRSGLKQKISKKDNWIIRVELNGTDLNPYHRLGLTQNPFPQTGKDEWKMAELQMQKLGGDPIPADRPAEYISEVLAGFSPEFIQKCIENYRPGRIVKFEVFWPKNGVAD